MKLPVIAEWHTSDLTADCLMAVRLKHLGQFEPRCPSAMFRGLVAGEALSMLHRTAWHEHVDVQDAIQTVKETLASENRPLTDGVDEAEIAKEVEKILQLYAVRFTKFFSMCKYIGSEVPVRCEIEVDGEPIKFASHLDLLFRRFDNELIVDDFKWWGESPTSTFLSRNLQLAMYAYSLRHGSVMIDGDWIDFGEWPVVRWIDLPNLKPYARNGADFRAGDLRSDDKIVRAVPFNATCEKAIREAFATRVRMWKTGLFPASPSPIGCFCCDSKKWCPQLSIQHEGSQ